MELCSHVFVVCMATRKIWRLLVATCNTNPTCYTVHTGYELIESCGDAPTGTRTVHDRAYRVDSTKSAMSCTHKT